MRKTLGLDFGHCEVAVSLSMDGKKPESLILDGNKAKVIPAQLALTQEQLQSLRALPVGPWNTEALAKLGPIAIGDDAAPKNDDRSSVINFMYFKKAPGYFAEIFEGQLPRGALMAAYLHQLVDQIFAYNPDYLGPQDRGEIELLVGCPTTEEWTGATAAAAYETLIRNATGVRNVRTVPESRAAMFSSIESAQTRVSAAGGAVVFDFGSSTADCTYMLLGRRCIEFSWRLGAQQIEAQMARVAFDGQHPTLISRVYVTNQLRKQKELYYSGTFGPKGQRLFYDVQDKNGNDIEAYIRVNDDQMAEVTAGEDHEIEIVCDSTDSRVGTWQSLCRDFFREAKDRLDSQELPYSDIVLTGGASRMAFIPEYCREIFGDDVTVHLEKNPSFSVANGLGWVSAIDARVPQTVTQSRNTLSAMPEIQVDQLKTKIATRLQTLIVDIVKTDAAQWASLSGEHSVKELLDSIQATVNKPENQQTIHTVMEEELAAWKLAFQNAVKDVINQNTATLMTEKIAEGVTLTKDVWEHLRSAELSAGVIDVDQILNGIDLNSMFNSILKNAIAWTCVIVGMELGGILGAALGGAAGFLAGAFMDDSSVTKLRDQRYRQRLRDRIGTAMGKDDTTKKIAASVGEQLKSIYDTYPQVVETTLKTAYEVVTLSRFEE